MIKFNRTLNKFNALIKLYFVVLLLIAFTSFIKVNAQDMPVHVVVGAQEGTIFISQISTESTFSQDGNTKIILKILGGNFTSGSKILVGDTYGIVTFIDSETLTVTTDINKDGQYQIKVINPDQSFAQKLFEYQDIGGLPETGSSYIETLISGPIAESGLVITSFVASIAGIFASTDYLKLIFLPYKKRKKYWGLVLDRSTGLPIPFTVIELHDSKTKKEISTTISDMEGRYGLIADPGEYYLEISIDELKLPQKARLSFYQ